MITTYDADGQIAPDRTSYLNTLGQSRVRSPFIFQQPIDGNFSPHSCELERAAGTAGGDGLRMRASYMQHESKGLAILTVMPPDQESSNGAYVLQGAGKARYRQFELTARMRLAPERQLYLSYMYSRGRGDLNDFSTYLSTFPAPIIRPN